jgi:hypothetical protein
MVFAAEGSHSEGSIEAFVSEKLGGLPPSERLAALEKLTERFAGGLRGETAGLGTPDDQVRSRVFSLLLGKKVSRADLSSTELLERLADSLNTVFDSLNQLVGVINTTLTGQGTGEQTIRQVIGGHVEGAEQAKSLESYLGQIKKAFLVAQEAFKKAARAKVNQMLDELDPEAISEGGGGRLKFGPLRKAELFDVYEERFGNVKTWFVSGRFMEEFLREFEKNAQRLS